MHRRGVAMLDVLIAAAILGLALIPVIQLFSSASRQAANTSNHGQALALLAKVGDEVRVAAWENPYLLDQVDTLALGGRRERVVDGGSPFFAPIEDDRPPFGKLERETDGGITSASRALYRQLSIYRMAMAVPAGTAPAGEPVSLGLVTDWTTPDDRAVEARVPVDVARFGRWTEVPAAVRDRTAVDAAIATLLYGSGVTDLTATAAARGAKLASLRALGELALVAQGLAEYTTRTQGAIGALGGVTGTPGAVARARVAAARLYESRAAAAVQAIVHLEPQFKLVAESLVAADLGSPPPAAPQWRALALDARLVRARFQSALQSARTAYSALASNAQLPARVRVRIILKVIDLTKLAALTYAPADVATVRECAQVLERMQGGRNPNFVALAKAEERLAADEATLAAADPVPRRAEAYRSVGELEAAATARIVEATQGLNLPGEQPPAGDPPASSPPASSTPASGPPVSDLLGGGTGGGLPGGSGSGDTPPTGGNPNQPPGGTQ